MDDDNLFLGLSVAGVLLLFAFTGVLRTSFGVLLRQGQQDFLPEISPPSPEYERLRLLAPETQGILGILRLLLTLLATLLATILAFSLGLSGWGMAIAFGLLLLVLLALEGGAQIIGRRYSEQIAPRGATVLSVLTIILGPLVRYLPLKQENGSARALLEPLSLSTPSELSVEGDPLFDRGEIQMARAVLNLERTQVKEVLVPRVDIVAAEADDHPSRVVELALTHGYSRIPVYHETVDQIVGIVYARDLLRYLQEGTLQKGTLRDLVRPTMFVPESKRVYELLREFQEQRVHIAIVVDEYGGTAGLVTIEDLLEEIVGEIEDEFDKEEPKVERLGDGEAIVDARLSLDDLREHFGVKVQGEGFDTVGGLVYSQLGKVPGPGDQFTAAGICVEVLSTTGRRIRKVRVTRQVDPRPEKKRS